MINKSNNRNKYPPKKSCLSCNMEMHNSNVNSYTNVICASRSSNPITVDSSSLRLVLLVLFVALCLPCLLHIERCLLILDALLGRP